MSVSNYTPNKCRYLISQLEEVVYLVSEEALKDIKIDNGSAYVASITNDTPLSIKCYNIKLTEDEVLDERYRFTHTVTFSVRGYMNKDNFNEKYYVILKDKEGTYWLINPLFPSKVTYTYTLGENQNHTDFTLATASNHPVLRLMEFSITDSNECDSYFYDGIDELKLNEKKYSAHIDNHVKYTNGGFKDVVFNEKTCVVTETFDGNKISHQIDFNILLSQYKNDWHYSLLEFKDNLYAAVIKTLNGKYALMGFSFGMQPSFTINGESQTTSDHIKITLTDAHDDGDPLQFYDSVDYEYLSAMTWSYTATRGGYDCVGEGIARYLLKAEIDALENETGNFQVLEGYESYFPELNIVGTFSTTETFTNVDCRGNDCAITTSLPGTLEFNSVECQTYYVESDTNWSIESSKSHITVSPASGFANVAYTINVCNTLAPTSSAETSTLTIGYCSRTSTIGVLVIEDENACLPQGAVYNISANEQTLTIPTKCCIESVRETAGAGSVSSVYSTYIQTLVPANNTGSNRQFVLLVIYCDGTSGNIIINQSNIFEEWRVSGTICVDRDKYQRKYKWTGTTTSNYVITDEFEDILVEYDSYDCYTTDEWNYKKYVLVDDDWFCDDGNKYGLLRMYVSMDNVNWRPTDIYKQGELIEEHSTDCCWDSKWDNYPYTKYEIVEGEWICNDGNKYQKLLRYFSLDGVNWESSICIFKMGELIEEKSEDCGYINDPNKQFRWILTNETVCIPYDDNIYIYRWYVKDENEVTYIGDDTYTVEYYQYSADSGLTWTDMTPEQTRPGEPVEFRWVNLDPTIQGNYYCSGTTKYYKQQKQMRLIAEDWKNVSPAVYQPGSAYEYQSADCGYEAPTYFTFIATESGTFKFSGRTSANTLSYSLDSGSTWTALASDTSSPTVASGSKIMWKGSGLTSSSSDYPYGIGKFSSTGNFTVEGNIMSLLYGDNFSGQTDLTGNGYTFANLFSGCTGITSAENLSLPATTLTNHCYWYMFRGCTSLTTAPAVLPATILAQSCYIDMFNGCTSLTTAPELPATTLASNCYGSMFYGCTSLTTAPELPATTLPRSCYSNMFYGCTSLTTAPDLPATTLVESCYEFMFFGCTSLNYIKCLATDISASECTYYWVYNVPSSGTFVKSSNSTAWDGWGCSQSKIPCDWTVENDS